MRKITLNWTNYGDDYVIKNIYLFDNVFLITFVFMYFKYAINDFLEHLITMYLNTLIDNIELHFVYNVD